MYHSQEIQEFFTAVFIIVLQVLGFDRPVLAKIGSVRLTCYRS